MWRGAVAAVDHAVVAVSAVHEVLLGVVTRLAGPACRENVDNVIRRWPNVPIFLAKQVSTRAMVAKAAQEPQLPWLLTGVTRPAVTAL